MAWAVLSRDRGMAMWQNGRYEIEKVLAVGDVYTSFVAWDHHLHMRVVIKRLQRRHGPDLREHWVRQVRALRMTSHPNLMRSYEFFDHDGQPSMVLEYLEGKPLDVVLRGKDQDPIQLALLLAGTAAGLHALHSYGFTHDHVQPANLIVDVCCRGIVLAEPGTTTAEESPTRTPRQPDSSPEERAQRLVGPPSDVYSLGQVLQETLLGTSPPHGLEKVVARCLCDSPAARPTARELAREIRTVLGECRRIAPASAPAAQRSILFAEDGSGFSWSDGQTVNLARRKTLQRLLVALLEQRIHRPGEELPVASLIEAGWPGQRLLREAAINRLYVGLSTLRNLGLSDVIERHNMGYRLSPSVRVNVGSPAVRQASVA